ncbi:vitamin K epoxide reductase family protein [Phototrophicus methaneseepsis]|uniref:Vitamin K epoxide reductase family protein n=1 Tax=Phototrophicus methaneseepsis TaxID=2710758 RepID=A0A7S8E997_9CHLR|nr:vitamin K epoxide reductase family protein [Phototrophicus methaneseepsis]QPC82736.1 vitamin K epoxide reductase family protein [Phototrophicus methaneseepsis]
MRLKGFFISILLLLASIIPTVQAQQPVVYGVFFYSPTCPHCHDVLTNHWPGIEEMFGDQLRVSFVDASTTGGNALMQETRTVLHIEATGVPMLIIGDRVLVGSVDIPAQTPQIVRDGLANGGIPLPDVPALREAYTESMTAQGLEVDQAALGHSAEVAAQSVTQQTLLDKLAADPIANAAAVGVLIALVASLIALIPAVRRRISTPLERPALLVLGVAGILIGGTLLSGSLGESTVAILALALVIVFLILLISAGCGSLRAADWLIPVISLVGLAVAGYLTYVEMTLSDAVCGAVGNCNTVQQSEYARIFGVPIGMIGLFGYSLIVLVWAYSHFFSEGRLHSLIWLLALVGVVFSIYLTFLEPFVIGATCLWCLSSAVVMLALLWLTTPDVASLQTAPPQVTQKRHA